MQCTLSNCLTTAVGLGLLAGAAMAQPKFIHTSNATDLTADGNAVVGSILDPNVDTRLHIFTRGVGHTFPGPILASRDGHLEISDDKLFISSSLYNGLFGPQNPPFGTYDNGNGHYIAHRLSVASGTWSNLGAFPNVAGLGAAKCDATINTSYGMSSNGRFVTGGGWYGAYGSTSCSTRGFLADANTGVVRQLPMVGTGCQAFSQGERVSTDGLVVMGSDSHTSPDNEICNARCITVWERANDSSDFLAAGRTVLDGWGAGGLSAAAMTRQGTQVATGMSQGQATALGDVSLAKNLWKYVKNTTTGNWDRVNLGRIAPFNSVDVACMTPAAISDDGNTIIGIARYGACGFFGNPRPFIWRPTINGGVPIDFEAYLSGLPGGNPFPPGAISLQQGISADGNALLARLTPAPPNCPEGQGLQSLPQSGILYLDGSSIGCEPPRIAGGPYDRIQDEYTIFGIVGNVFVSGSAPMTMQWQKEVPAGSGTWVNLTDSCGVFDADQSWTYEGTTGFQLRVNMLANAADRDGRYRAVATNACGTATSQVAQIGVVSGACCYVQGGQVMCTIEMPTRCTGSAVISYFLGGQYLGDNTTCAPTTCDSVVGACCFGAGGANAQCVLSIGSNCTESPDNGGIGGSFAGAGTTCSPASCALVSGACCYSLDNTSNAVCTTELASRCNTNVASGGVAGAYLGNNTTCQPNSCNTVAGACCYAPDDASGVICTIQTQTRCTNLASLPSQPNYFSGLQGIYVGHGSTCLPVSQQCGFVAGACCYSLDDTSNAICTVQLQDKCTRATNNSGLGGTYRGDGTTCGPSSCTTVTGACCYSTFDDPSTVLCTIQPATRCTNRFNAGGLFGAYLGGGSACGPTACDAAMGACCYTDFSGCLVCVLTPGATRCTDEFNGGLNGTYAGNGTVCLPTSCPSEGACCVSNVCSVTCQAICEANLGTFFGVGSTCTPDPCNPAVGACCRGSTCLVEAQTACVGSNTGFGGAATVCNVFSVNNTSPCCFADFNHVGGVTVQDIFDFLAAYFSASNTADINGGGIGVQDIFDYLASYFTGC